MLAKDNSVFILVCFGAKIMGVSIHWTGLLD